MKKLLIVVVLFAAIANTALAQKNPFKKKKNKKAVEQVDEKVDEVEEQIKQETKKLEKQIDKKTGEAQEETGDKQAEMKEKVEELKNEEVKEAVDKTAASVNELSAEAEVRKAKLMALMKEKITVTEEDGSISTGLQNGYVVVINGGETGKVEKHWKKYLKSAFKGKTDLAKGGEILAENVEIPTVGSSVNIYARVKELSGGAAIHTYFDTGDGYLNSTDNAEGHKLIEKLMYDFGVQERKFAIEQEINREEKSLKKMKKDLRNLEGDNEKYHKTIEKAKNDIVENEQKQVEKNAEISNQDIIIETIKQMLDAVE